MSASAYPLSWPTGWKRTSSRYSSKFSRKVHNGRWNEAVAITVEVGRRRLAVELGRLGATNIILSTNLELRADGNPKAQPRIMTDPGVAVYFDLKRKPVVLASDKWDTVGDNMAAIAKHIEALRGMDRWGVGSVEQAFAGYQALPAPDPWWKLLGLPEPTRSKDEIEAAYRRASSGAHPDRPGGSHDRMAAVNGARDEGLAALVGPAA